MGKRGKKDPLSIVEYSDQLFAVAYSNGYELGLQREEDSE